MIKYFVALRNYHYKFKGLFVKMYLLSFGCKVGTNLKCKKIPIFKSFPSLNFEIGDNVNLGYRITFDVQKSGFLKIGNRVNLTQDIIISAINSVIIGDDCLIAEFVSIRDGDHIFEKGKTINSQGLNSDKIKIGNDVWIAAGTRVLKGANLPDGCIIGANSLVLKKTVLESNNIYAGAPVIEISKR
jgi:acetyltransferase-like isoleucine patch superfamily enzyme